MSQTSFMSFLVANSTNPAMLARYDQRNQAQAGDDQQHTSRAPPARTEFDH